MLREVFVYFLKLGLTGFGGPLALIGSMQKDLVEHRKWISKERFQISFSLIKSMPGPIAFSTAVFLGRVHAGLWGGFLAGVALLAPAFCLMILFGYLMFHSNQAESFQRIASLLQIPALAVIVASLRSLARGFETQALFWLFVILAGVLSVFFPVWEPLIIVGLGVLSIFIKKVPAEAAMGLLLVPSLSHANEVAKLFWICFKAGAFVFGSGLAILPLLETEVVQNQNWMTSSEFLNAVALGQVTPGPVTITATVIGFKVAGAVGAFVGTIAIFLASFVHMMTWFPKVITVLEKKSWIPLFTRGALGAVLGSIIVSVFRLSEDIKWNVGYFFVFIVIAVITDRKWVPAWAAIPLGGLMAFVLEFLVF